MITCVLCLLQASYVFFMCFKYLNCLHMYMCIWFEFKTQGQVAKKINFPSKGATITFFWNKKTGADFPKKTNFVSWRKLIQQGKDQSN